MIRRLTALIPLPVALAAGFVVHERGRLSGIRLAMLSAVLWVRSRMTSPERSFAVAVRGPNGQTVRLWIWEYLDLLILREVFLDEEYRPARLHHVSSVLDIGSNIGISVLYFRALFPEAQLIAVEPDPRLFRRLQKNLSADGAVQLFNVAVADHARDAPFMQAAESWRSALAPEHSEDTIQVPCRRPSDIVNKAGMAHVDLVKLDIEGGEWPLLESGLFDDLAGGLVGELHATNWNDPADAERLLAGWRLEIAYRTPTAANFHAWRGFS